MVWPMAINLIQAVCFRINIHRGESMTPNKSWEEILNNIIPGEASEKIKAEAEEYAKSLGVQEEPENTPQQPYPTIPVGAFNPSASFPLGYPSMISTFFISPPLVMGGPYPTIAAPPPPILTPQEHWLDRAMKTIAKMKEDKNGDV